MQSKSPFKVFPRDWHKYSEAKRSGLIKVRLHISAVPLNIALLLPLNSIMHTYLDFPPFVVTTFMLTVRSNPVLGEVSELSLGDESCDSSCRS